METPTTYLAIEAELRELFARGRLEGCSISLYYDTGEVLSLGVVAKAAATASRSIQAFWPRGGLVGLDTDARRNGRI